MLMMLVVWRDRGKRYGHADALDAGRLAGLWKILGQLVGEKVGTHDAHDAGRLARFGEKVRTADSHDAGRFAGGWGTSTGS